jgi:hypothetical protein
MIKIKEKKKIAKAKKIWSMAQVVVNLAIKHEALSSCQHHQEKNQFRALLYTEVIKGMYNNKIIYASIYNYSHIAK